jgi:ammonium transporter, Amt family
MTPPFAILTGLVAGVVCSMSALWLLRLGLDDVVGAVSAHGFAGIWGTIAVVFTNSDANIGTQLFSIVVVGLFVFIVSFIVWLILKMTIGLRPSEDDEALGLDKAEVGVEAYPEF